MCISFFFSLCCVNEDTTMNEYKQCPSEIRGNYIIADINMSKKKKKKKEKYYLITRTQLNPLDYINNTCYVQMTAKN